MALNSCRRLKRVLDVTVFLLGLLLFAPAILGAAMIYLPEYRAAAAVQPIQDSPDAAGLGTCHADSSGGDGFLRPPDWA